MSLTIQNPNHKEDEFVHFQKINLFGESGVGKSSFIKYLQNFNNSEFTINNEIERQQSIDSSLTPFLVEQIEMITIDFNEDRNLYFTVVESNLDDYDSIKTNLDTLLVQTECIIIMWDNNNEDSFDNIPNFVSTIEAGMGDFIFRDAPIFVIQNKIDLDNKDEKNKEDEINKLIDKFKKEHPKIFYEKLSLFDSDSFYELVLKIYQKMEILEKDLKIAELKIRKEDNIINNVKFKRELKDKNMNVNNELDNLKCILLGDTTVGKSTFINYLLGKKIFETLPNIEIGDTIFVAEVEKEIVNFKLVDSAGQEKYNAIPDSLFKNADCILLFFDVTNENSFKRLSNWIENIKKYGQIHKHFELLLIGNKIDLNENRQVNKKEAIEFAKENKIKYFEFSSLKGINVYELLNEITFMAYERFMEKNKEKAKSITIHKKKAKKRKKICC